MPLILISTSCMDCYDDIIFFVFSIGGWFISILVGIPKRPHLVPQNNKLSMLDRNSQLSIFQKRGYISPSLVYWDTTIGMHPLFHASHLTLPCSPHSQVPLNYLNLEWLHNMGVLQNPHIVLLSLIQYLGFIHCMVFFGGGGGIWVSLPPHF